MQGAPQLARDVLDRQLHSGSVEALNLVFVGFEIERHESPIYPPGFYAILRDLCTLYHDESMCRTSNFP